MLGRPLAASALALLVTLPLWWWLGRVDPLLMAPALILTAWLPARRGIRAVPPHAVDILLAVMATAASLAALGWWLAGAIDGRSLAIMVVVQAAALYGRRWFDAWRWPARIAAIALGTAALMAALDVGYRPRCAGAPPRVALLTSLPLVWGDGDIGAILGGATAPDPAYRLLSQRVALTPFDALDATVVTRTDVLLLAHPRALPPEQLVLIDEWVRGGGAALVLADPLSLWPTERPLGDPANPPVTSLLTPLLTRWGLTLDAPPGLAAQTVDQPVGASRLTLAGAGRFQAALPDCRLSAGRRIAACRIGRGEALLLADADLLHEPLWRAPLPWPTDTALVARNDNLRWLVGRLNALGGAGSCAAMLTPLWVRP